jgi:glycosyltransferase involved in cell wall biosynthesis
MLAGPVRGHTIRPGTARYPPSVRTTVLVDAWHLGGFSSGRGVGTYLRHLLSGLSSDPDLHLVALATSDTALPGGVDRWPIRRIAPNRFAQREHDLRLPRDLTHATKASRADVVFSPADNIPRRSPRPWVQTVHDLIPLAAPDPAFEIAAQRWRRIGRRLGSAAAVVADSHNTAADVVRFFDVDPGTVHVAHLGIDPAFRPPPARTGTDPPTILYVGEYGPHKGFAEAFATAGGIAEAGLPHRLAMVGFLAPWYQRRVRSLRADSPRPDRVDLLGRVDDLASRYQQADALIVTSRYEGFCLPGVEAMACGTPVVAFANSAVTEVVGDGGILVGDGDVAEMVAALRTILTDPAAWDEASVRGLERARAFSWKRCVEIHAELFRSVAG